MNKLETKHSYAQITTGIFRSRNQDIIIYASENVKLQDYMSARQTSSSPFESPTTESIYIPQIHLIIDQFFTFHLTITIGNINLKVRKHYQPIEKVHLSNVSPYISHSIIERALTEKHLELSSAISFTRASISDEQ